MTGILKVIADEERELPFLLVGGLAVVLHGYPRSTFDIDLMIPEEALDEWLEFLHGSGLKEFRRSESFVQFEGSGPTTGVDLMIVDGPTFEKLSRDAAVKMLAETEVRIPSAEHLVALKLHAIRQEKRARKEQDWGDVIGLIQCCGLDVSERSFGSLIEKYGGPGTAKEIERRLLKGGR